MNIFLHELKSYRKSTLIWTCSLAGLTIFLLSLYPAFSNDASEAAKMLQGFPEGIRKAFGLTLENLTSFLGFYSFIFTYVLLLGAIQAMNLGVSIISKEVSLKTADFLLSKPVSRVKVVTSKILAGISCLLISDVIYIAVAGAMVLAVKNGAVSTKIFIMISITLFFVQLIFFAIGFIVSVIAPKIRSVISISLSTVFAFFITDMLGSVIGEKAVRYVTPFKYFDRMYIIKNASYEARFIVIEIVFVAAVISAGYFIYSRKDIHTV